MAFSEELYLNLRNRLQRLIGDVQERKVEKDDASGSSTALLCRIEEIERELGLVVNKEESERLTNLRRLHSQLEQRIRNS